jgi:sarcosine oxidase subunit beta
VEKAMVCACEDVSVHDVDEAIAHGFSDIESLKRYTGLGTGPCQGKSCTAAAVRLCATRAAAVRQGRGGVAGAAVEAPAQAEPRSGAAPRRREVLVPFRARPPQTPTALCDYAGLPLEELPAPAAATPHQQRARSREPVVAPPPPSPQRPLLAGLDQPGLPLLMSPLPERAEVVIIGGGIMGLALAYQLAGKGQRPLVLERGYLCAGASGRNGGGVRAQWTTPTLIELAKESIDFMGRFAQELGINVWLRKGGYLFLAHDAETVKRVEQGAELHRKHGLPTRIISPGEACELVPELDRSRFLAASWNPEDGVVFPWPFLWGYADGARKRGAQIETFTQVTGLEVAGGRVRAVRTDRGTVQADRVVIASGAWSPQISRLAGIELPNQPYRHEIVSSEPLKPFLGPLVSMLGTGLYFSQSMRGEIVGGMGDPMEPPGLNQSSSLRFLTRYARALTEIMPRVGQVKLLRQWAGCYDVTPDHSPILGETPGAAGLLQMSGFVGHGFMMAPAVARRMADWMGGAQDEMFERYSLRRFSEGRLEHESFIIG